MMKKMTKQDFESWIGKARNHNERENRKFLRDLVKSALVIVYIDELTNRGRVHITPNGKNNLSRNGMNLIEDTFPL